MSVQVEHRRDSNAVIETVTPAAAELGFDTTKKEALIGDGAVLGGIRLAKKNARDVLAVTIAADQNDYDPAGLAHARQLDITASGADRNVTGVHIRTVTDTTDGRELVVRNAGASNNVVLKNNITSTAAYRFDCGGADLTLNPGQTALFVYNNAASRWQYQAPAGATPGDNAVSARKLASSALAYGVGMVNGTLVESHAANAVTYAVKTLAGGDPSATDPVWFVFRDATAGNGNHVVREVTSALSFTFSSGSGAGMVNSTAGKIWLGALDNAGTVELFAINCRSGVDVYPLGQFPLITTTAEGGAGGATSAQVPYSTTARAAKAYVVLGYASYETGLAAAGTWNASPTRLQLYGPAVPLPGQRVQVARSDTGAMSTGTTLIPFDNTTPQNTEGDQYMSKAITPTSAANLLKVTSQAFFMCGTGNSTGLMALFQDAAANALKTAAVNDSSAAGFISCALAYIGLAGVAIATTFKIRIGPQLSGTVTFNGNAGAAILNGTLNSFVEIEEIAA